MGRGGVWWLRWGGAEETAARVREVTCMMPAGPRAETMLCSKDVLRQDSVTHSHLRTEHGELRPLVSGRVGCCLD